MDQMASRCDLFPLVCGFMSVKIIILLTNILNRKYLTDKIFHRLALFTDTIPSTITDRV